MNDIEIIEKTRALLEDKVLEISNPSPRRIFLKVDPKDLIKAVEVLKNGLGFVYLATVSGLDSGENFEIIYHFANAFSQLNLRTQIPKANPRVDSICAWIAFSAASARTRSCLMLRSRWTATSSNA